MTGDPGAGKSYVIETIVEIAHALSVGHVQTTSYNGIAAVNIDGETLCSLLGIGQSPNESLSFADAVNNISEDQLRSIRRNLHHSELALFIVDEISTLDAPMIAMIDARLQKAMKIGKPFGGVAMLFVGDFNQLGAVQKTFLLQDMLDWAEYQQYHKKTSKKGSTKKKKKMPVKTTTGDSSGMLHRASTETMMGAAGKIVEKQKRKEAKKVNKSLYSRYRVNGIVSHGCSKLSNFRRFHISTQQRSKDPTHNAFVQKLAAGQPIQMDDLAPYKKLSAEDTNDPTWKYAPILVSTNRERMSIVRKQSQLFARDHQTYVFKWKNQTQKWKNKPADLTQLYEENETLWQYFVPGADAFLNRNINAQLGLANGTQVVCHSLTLDPSGGDFDRLSTLLLERNLPYGSEVIMDQPPLAVNMRILPGLDGKLPSKHKQKQLQVLRQFSIDHGSSLL